MLEYSVNPLEDGATSVEVIFTETDEDIVYSRMVNAVFTNGVYDEEATITRIEEVKGGVQAKIDIGLITHQEPEPELEEPIPDPIPE